MGRVAVQPVALGDRGQDKRPLHQREAVADAQARPAAEGDVGEPRPRRRCLRRKAARLECLRVGPKQRVAVRHVGAHDNDRVSRDSRVADAVRGQCPARDEPRRRIKPQRLFKDHARVGQRRQVVGRGHPAAQCLVYFGLQLRARRRVLRQQMPGPRQRAGHRLVSGNDQRRHLVADLRVRHTLAGVLVPRRQQHRQDITLVASLGPPCADGVIEDAFQLGHRGAVAAVAAGRPGNGRRDHRLGPVDDVSQHLQHALGHLRRFVPQVKVKQCLADDLQRDLHHLRVHIDRRAVGPGIPADEHGRGRRADVVAEGVDALAVESGLHEPPLPQPQRTVARQQAAPGHLGQRVVLDGVLGVITVIVLQDVLDDRRVRDLEHLPQPQGVVDEVAVRCRMGHQETQRVPLNLRDARRQQLNRDSGRDGRRLSGRA